jgi:hypothetical protein
MNNSNLDILKTFTLDSLPDLDTVVLGALELYESTSLPKGTVTYTHPLVVGSGNAEATGRIMFEGSDAVFASESNYESKLATIKTIDGVVIISASGAKHAPGIVKRAKEYGKAVTLITTTKESEAEKLLDLTSSDAVYCFPKNREPYTYNTSTYLGMVLSTTEENSSEIHRYIEEVVQHIDFSVCKKYTKFFLIVPPSFHEVTRMLQIKFIELFGRQVSCTVATSEYVKHATTVVPSEELFISFGDENIVWGKEFNRLHIPLPENVRYGAMIAVAYYVIGRIQKELPAYFKDNIQEYTQFISSVFNEPISSIVE